MAASKVEQTNKRRNKRKSRTAAPSPSPSSSSSSDSSSSEQESPESPKAKRPARVEKANEDVSSPSPSPSPPDQSHAETVNPDQAFEEFYLRQMTREFANDLDKLRAAPDFNASRSVGLLVEALKQGTRCFSADQRAKIGAASSSS